MNLSPRSTKYMIAFNAECRLYTAHRRRVPLNQHHSALIAMTNSSMACSVDATGILLVTSCGSLWRIVALKRTEISLKRQMENEESRTRFLPACPLIVPFHFIPCCCVYAGFKLDIRIQKSQVRHIAGLVTTTGWTVSGSHHSLDSVHWIVTPDGTTTCSTVQ